MGVSIKYNVRLAPYQRDSLQAIARNGTRSAKKILHARILLMADKSHPEGNWSDQQIAQALNVHPNTVARIRKLFVTKGEAIALNRKARQTPPIPPKISQAKTAKLLALYHDSPPAGHDYWSLSLLVTELKKRGLVKSICRETVRKVLKQQGITLSRHKRIPSS